MSIDHKALREAYFNPPREGEFTKIPAREDYMAEAERRFVRLCLERGGDPKAEGLGEHGALIGGEGKPPRVLMGLARSLEHYAKPRLAPLDWFEREAVRSGNGRFDPEHRWMRRMAASYMAGVPKESSPSGEELHEAFCAAAPGSLQRFWLHSVLSCISMLELRGLMREEGLSIRVVVRALHNASVLRHDLCRWANQFAVNPRQAA